jgi:invasion protein IalB
LVEHVTENHGVGGSIPPLGTNFPDMKMRLSRGSAGGYASRLISVIVFAAGVAGARAQPPPVAPPAQQQHAEQGSNWRVECGNDGKVLDCRAIFQVTQRETQQLIAAVAIRIPPDTKKPVILIQLPLGIQVTEPVTVRVDEGAPEKFGVQTCTQAGCFVGAPIAEPLIAAMRAGKELKVAFANISKQTVTVSMGLLGFGLAYEKIK